MTYSLNITIETNIPEADVAEEVQAALGAWGIGSTNPVVQPANPFEQIVAEFAENLRQVVERDKAEAEEFCRRVTKIVDDFCCRNC